MCSRRICTSCQGSWYNQILMGLGFLTWGQKAGERRLVNTRCKITWLCSKHCKETQFPHRTVRCCPYEAPEPAPLCWARLEAHAHWKVRESRQRGTRAEDGSRSVHHFCPRPPARLSGLSPFVHQPPIWPLVLAGSTPGPGHTEAKAATQQGDWRHVLTYPPGSVPLTVDALQWRDLQSALGFRPKDPKDRTCTHSMIKFSTYLSVILFGLSSPLYCCFSGEVLSNTQKS